MSQRAFQRRPQVYDLNYLGPFVQGESQEENGLARILAGVLSTNLTQNIAIITRQVRIVLVLCWPCIFCFFSPNVLTLHRAA